MSGFKHSCNIRMPGSEVTEMISVDQELLQAIVRMHGSENVRPGLPRNCAGKPDRGMATRMVGIYVRLAASVTEDADESVLLAA